MSAGSPLTMAQDQGKVGAAAVYLLYLLSIPSAAVLALVGFVLAYLLRESSASWVRSHFDYQIRVGWACLWWSLAAFVLLGVGALLSIVLIGIPIVFLALAALFVIHVVFAVVAVLGLVSLLQNRPVAGAA